MATLHSALPAPTSTELMQVEDDTPLYSSESKAQRLNAIIPPQGSRASYVPRVREDFGDGGAFPEIHVAQYPLEMGRKGKSAQGQIVALTTDEEGKVEYDAVIRQGHHKDMVLYSKPGDLKNKSFTENELARPDEEEEAKVAEETKRKLEEKLQSKISAAQHVVAKNTAQAKAKYIRYTPANQNPEHNSGSKNRIIRLQEAHQDPLEPPKFKHVKKPPGPGSPPTTVMHSPPRKVSVEEREAWKIPPSISNWKNNKGYIIPLDKRLAADGRHLQETTISDHFASFSEALLIAERNAREELTKRQAVRKQLEIQKLNAKEEEYRRVAAEARQRRQQIEDETARNETKEERLARLEREKVREDRRRDREREHRLENRGAAAKAAEKKGQRSGPKRQRDITERIALGEVVPRSQESLYDQRLFNQSAGLSSGFGGEDDYNVYDKRLFGGERERLLNKAPTQEEAELYGEAENIDEIKKTDRFVPHKDFSGVDRTQKAAPRDGPVQYEKDDTKEGDDDWGLDDFLQENKKKEGSMKDARKVGVMAAAGGGAVGSEELRRGRDRKIGFTEASTPGENYKAGINDMGGGRDRANRSDRGRRSRSPPRRRRSRSPPIRRRSPPRRRSRSPRRSPYRRRSPPRRRERSRSPDYKRRRRD